MTPKLKAWIHALAATAIATFGTGLSATMADPKTFNFTPGGLEAFGKLLLFPVLAAVGAYLSKSPLPSTN